MNSRETFKYTFAILLSGVGGYGFITSISGWYWWLVASLLYLTCCKISKMMD